MIVLLKKVVTVATVIPLIFGMIHTVSAVEETQGKVQNVSLQEQATEYLKANAAQYSLKSDISDLQYVSTTDTEVASYVRFQQAVNGFPVFSKQVTVTLNKGGQGVLAVSDYLPVQSVKEIKQKLSEKEAEGKSSQYLEADDATLWAPTTREFGYIIEEGVAIPVYRVVIHSQKPFGAWETFIDAENGKLLKKKDLN